MFIALMFPFGHEGTIIIIIIQSCQRSFKDALYLFVFVWIQNMFMLQQTKFSQLTTIDDNYANYSTINTKVETLNKCF